MVPGASREAALSRALSCAVVVVSLVAAVSPDAAFAGLYTKVGSFAAKTTGPPTNRAQSVTGVGFQPAALIFFWTAQTAAGFANGAAAGYGFATGAGSERAVIYASDHNQPTDGNSMRRQSETRSILVMSSSGVLDADAQLTSMDVDGFTLNWNTGASSAWLIQYMAIGGGDVTGAATGTFTPVDDGLVSQSITGVAFQPDLLMFLSIDSDTVNGNVGEGRLSIGFAGLSGGSTITQGAITVATKNLGGGNVISTVWQRPNRALLEKDTGLFNPTLEAEVTSFDANGFTIMKYVNDTGTQTRAHYLALQGGQYKLGTFTRPGATGSVGYTGVGFVPHGLIFFSKNIGTSVNANEVARISFSAADTGIPNPFPPFSPNQMATFFEDHIDRPSDGDNTFVRQGNSQNKVVFLAQAGDCPPTWTEPANPNQCSGAARVLAEADASSYDADGFTLNWTTVDTVNLNDPGNETLAETVYLALGNDETTAVELVSFAAEGGDGEARIQWRTASEIDNLGFHLYRSTSADGPYERITANVIPGLGSSPEGAAYSYLDSNLANGVEYFYQLEDIETTGATERHGPVSATPQAAAGSSGSPTEEEQSEVRITYGDPLANRFRVVNWSEKGATLELATEGFYAVPLPDGSVRFEIPHYDLLGEGGVPSLPVRRSWVEAVSGVGVQLTRMEESLVTHFGSLRPSGVGTGEIVGSRTGTQRISRAHQGTAARMTGRVYPVRVARLLETGYQGDVKKAQVEMAPMRWDGARGELRLARLLRVQLAFRGPAPDEISTGRSRGRISPTRRSYRREVDSVARLVTTARGLHVVRYKDVFRGRRRYSAQDLDLSRLGESVAFHIEPDAGSFGPGSRLYFVTAGPEANPYGHEVVYELSLGRSGMPMDVVSAKPVGDATPYFWAHLPREVNAYYQAGLLKAPDRWLWDVVMSGTTKSYAFAVTRLAPASESPRLSVRLQGASDFPVNPDHHIRAYVNGSLVGEALWDGKSPYSIEEELPPALLREGENVLALENAGDTLAAYSMAFLDGFSVDYPRLLEAEGGRLEGRWSLSGAASISGVSTSARVVDITSGSPVWLRDVEPGGVEGVRFLAAAGRHYAVVSPEAVLRPAIRRPGRSHLKSSGNEADYLVVGPAGFLDVAAPLLELRRGQGLRVRAVGVEEIFDEFGFGEARPEAIRDFLAYAFHFWREPHVRYVLLLGDGTYDFKDYLGTGVVNRVPPVMVETPYLWTVSDPTLAMVNGDDRLPDLAVGRLPASTAEELRVMMAKIVDFESRPLPLSGPVVLVTDDPDEAGNFVANAEDLETSVLADREVVAVHLSELGASSTRTEIVRHFDDGASIVSYVGHGGIALWADENIFNISDVSRLEPQSQQPLLVTMNCLNGYFVFPYFNSLSEELLKAEGKGVIAAFSPSGLSLNEPAHEYHSALLRAVFNRAHARIGDAVLEAQEKFAASGDSSGLVRIYHLLGDPALRLH